MIKYAKVINEKTHECWVGLGSDIEFFKKQGFTEQDVTHAYDGCWYITGYEPTPPAEYLEKQERIKKMQLKKG